MSTDLDKGWHERRRRVEPLTPLQIVGIHGELVIAAARRISGVQEWRNRDTAGHGVTVEAMADVVRLADALDSYDEAQSAFRGYREYGRG